jgi:hypothetical protein
LETFEKNKAFKFEYVNNQNPRFVIPVIILSFFAIIFFTIFFTIQLDHLFKNEINFFISSFFVGSISFGVYKFKTKNIKKLGSGVLYDDFLEIHLEKQSIEIKYYDINEYKIKMDAHGTNLSIKTINDKNYLIVSPSSFCDFFGFFTFTKEFEETFTTYKKENPSLFIKDKY